MRAAGMTKSYSCIWRSFEDIGSGCHQFGDELKVKERPRRPTSVSPARKAVGDWRRSFVPVAVSSPGARPMICRTPRTVEMPQKHQVGQAGQVM